jgi:SsrA-binding protein
MAAEKDKIEKTVNIRNKKASFEYHFLDTFVAGIVLQGTEIKSIRQQKMNFQDAYCYVADGEIFVKNLHISHYGDGSWLNHVPLRERKLLLKKKEISKIDNKLYYRSWFRKNGNSCRKRKETIRQT